MVTAIWGVSLVASALVVADELRRPASDWTAADRNRGYWVGMTITAGFLFLGVPAALIYAVALVPRFAMAQHSDAAFRKSALTRPTASPPSIVSTTSPPPPPPSVAPTAPQPPEEPAGSLPAVGAPRKLVIEFDDI